MYFFMDKGWFQVVFVGDTEEKNYNGILENMNSKASKQDMVALPLMDAATSILFVQQNPHIKHIKLSLLTKF